MEQVGWVPSFSSSAEAATEPAPLVARPLYDVAKVSGQVASHTRGRPKLHGTRDMPSGLLPSNLHNPGGSSLDGIPAVVRARWMMSLIAA